jgi:hypothetical protein
MTHIIRLIGMPDGSALPQSGLFLKDADFVTESFTWTYEQAEAKQFDDAGQALDFWRTQSTIWPLRSDGKPNRPLTALSAEFIKISDENNHEPEHLWIEGIETDDVDPGQLICSLCRIPKGIELSNHCLGAQTDRNKSAEFQ